MASKRHLPNDSAHFRSQRSLCPSQAIPGVGTHLHTPGHHGDTQGWGAPDLSDDQGWAPAPTYPWASPPNAKYMAPDVARGLESRAWRSLTLHFSHSSNRRRFSLTIWVRFPTCVGNLASRIHQRFFGAVAAHCCHDRRVWARSPAKSNSPTDRLTFLITNT
jgi:hypothetical protein